MRVCINIFRRGNKPQGQQEGRLSRQQQHSRQERTRPRPIIVVFLRQSEKSQLFGDLKTLKGNDRWRLVFFNDDLTEFQANEQKDLRSPVPDAISLAREDSFKANSFWLGGRQYRYEQLRKLPPEISQGILEAKTLFILEDKTVHNHPYPFIPATLSCRGVCFLSADGTIHYHRTLTSGHEIEANKTKIVRNPYFEKRTSKALKASQEWEDINEDVRREIFKAKFSQNDFCNQFLLGTGDRRLFEGTGDKKCACGIPPSKARLISLKSPGRNLLGFMLEGKG